MVMIIIVIIQLDKGALLGHAIFLTEILTAVVVNLQNLHAGRNWPFAQDLIKSLTITTPWSVEK